MTAEWLVVRLEEGSEEGSARRFESSADVQAHIAKMISDGVPPESVLLYSAKNLEYSVVYRPVINLGDEPAGAAEAHDDAAPDKPEPQGSQNGVRLSSMFKPS